jgi:hypothetical protein
MVEDDLSQVEESATKSTYRLGVGFERCEDKGEKSAPKFIPSSTYHQEEKTIKSTKAQYPSNPKPSFNPKREVKRETPKPREETFERKLLFACFDYARNSYHDEFIDFPPRSYYHALPRTYSHALPCTYSHALPHFSR